jgi:hypothetical protein
MGYAETLHNADCKILIYGDSSAMVGVDPTTVQEITGLSTCNIAEYLGITVVNNTMPLDDYLANNPKPEYLIFLFGPESYGAPPPWGDMDVAEALAYRFQFHRDLASSLLVAKHPSEVLGWLEHELRFLIAHPRVKPTSPEIMNIRASLKGRFPMSSAPLTTCMPVRKVEPRRDWIEGLRAKYGIPGTKVLIDVTPVPSCETTFPFYRDHLKGIVDNELVQSATAEYVTDGRLHLGYDGVLKLSNAIGSQIIAERGR